LVEELKQLWIGVPMYNVQKPLASSSFTLKGMLLWTIHDFPRYGIVVRVAHQGFVACPICGPEFRGEHLVELSKQTYTGTHQWLPDGHPYKSVRMFNHFNGQLKTCLRPKSVIIKE
jgi:hypothetical protein